MGISTKQVFTILLIISWIIFVGICIEAGGFITNAVFAIAKPGVVKHLWQQVDLTDLLRYDTGQFFVEVCIISIVLVLKAILFYLIIKMLHNKNISLARPFNDAVRRFVFNLSYIALGIGLFSFYGVKYAEWLTARGVKMPDTQYLRIGGADVWLFMCVILFVIAQIFKKGIEIQTENELTV